MKKMIEISVRKITLRNSVHREYPVIILRTKRELNKKEPERLIQVSVRLPASTLNKIHMICNKHQIQRSKLIRRAINEFLEKFDGV
jgi:TusA-related sulfurtransferase